MVPPSNLAVPKTFNDLEGDFFITTNFLLGGFINPHLRTTYLNFLLSLTEILCKSHEELSNSDLADAYSSLTYLTKPGFKLDWLEKALKEAGETRIQDIEEELNDLTQKCADMDALQKSHHQEQWGMKLIRSSLGLLRISPLGDPSVFGLVHSCSVNANGKNKNLSACDTIVFCSYK
ncbi:hypothetical protein YC2023_095572 [Brassica napus]